MFPWRAKDTDKTNKTSRNIFWAVMLRYYIFQQDSSSTGTAKMTLRMKRAIFAPHYNVSSKFYFLCRSQHVNAIHWSHNRIQQNSYTSTLTLLSIPGNKPRKGSGDQEEDSRNQDAHVRHSSRIKKKNSRHWRLPSEKTTLFFRVVGSFLRCERCSLYKHGNSLCLLLVCLHG